MPPPQVKKVLIVDDNADIRESLKRVLERAGYAVELARDGDEALSRQKANPANVLITDLFMPERDGFETLAAFRKAYPRTRIVAISGESRVTRRDYLESARLIGVDAIFRKPVDPQQLVETLRRF